MPAVLRNIDLRGATMGSGREFKEMDEFVREKKVRPVVSRVAKGLDNIRDIDGLFKDMENSSLFGKLIIEVLPEDVSSKL